MEMTEQTRAELIEVVERMGQQLDKLQAAWEQLTKREEDEPLDDDKVAGITERLGAEPLDSHVGALLAVHKCVENATVGRVRYLTRVEAVAMISLLNRVLPGAVDRILDEWDWSEIVEQLEGGGDDA